MVKISYFEGLEGEIDLNEERIRHLASKAPNGVRRGASSTPTPQEARKVVEAMAFLKWSPASGKGSTDAS